MTKEDFLKAATAAAKDASAKSGLPAGITVAQAALESAWGQSGLSRTANNYFGIKAHGKHATIELPTIEVSDGLSEQTIANFARYESMADCFADRDRLIMTSAHYAEAKACAADPEKFVRALAKHWATDSQYAEKVLSIYRTHNLQELDLVSVCK